MANEDGSVRIVFNGEIYNHKLLRRELEGRFPFRSRSDTEAILRGYEAWGADVVPRLDGMFAIGIWDAKRRHVVLARDRAGKKPLFYTTSGRLRFGSTIGALIASGHAARMRTAALPIYLSYGFVPAPDTFYEGVAQLLPGERILFELDADGNVLRSRADRYWEPSFGTRPCADDYATAKRRVRSLLDEAVDRRLESDVPLGAFLSGGIDSSIIVGLMSRQLGKVRTFSIGFAGDPRYDETHYARVAAKAFGTEHTEFTLHPSSFELVESLVVHHDGPFGDSSAIPTSVVSKLTREHVTVALTGDGGDELFCGYHRFLAAEAAERIPLSLRQLAARAADHLPSSSERSLPGRGRRFLRSAALPLADRMARWNSFFPEPGQILRRDLSFDLEAPLAWQRKMFAMSHGSTTLQRVLEHNFRTYLPEDLLVKADRCSMAHALETRSPFLDTALIEYVQQLPPAYLRRGTFTKRILKESYADLLPLEIQQRGKMGFGLPLGTWFRGDLRGYMRERLGTGARLNEYLDASAVAQVLNEHEAGTADHGQRIWALLTLEIWLRGMSRAASAAA
jgi:asparagine synthase (glutamine-hydrolysing)